MRSASSTNSNRPVEFEVLGVRVNNVPLADAVGDIVARVRDEAAAPCQFCFVNTHCVNVAARDAAYMAILRRAPRAFADGIGIKLAARAHGIEVVDNVNGTDLFPRLCSALQGTGIRLYLLGARPGVVNGVRSWIESTYPDVDVVGSHHGYFKDDEAVVKDIRDSGAQLLLAAMGVPRQELWIDQHLHRCGVRVAIGVGALFDFYSGAMPRAPRWMRARGMEWVYRLYQEPGRMWRRYVVGNPRFLWRVIWEDRRYLPSITRVSRLLRLRRA